MSNKHQLAFNQTPRRGRHLSQGTYLLYFPAEETAKTVTAYDDMTNDSLSAFVDKSGKIGGDVDKVVIFQLFLSNQETLIAFFWQVLGGQVLNKCGI